MMTNKGEIMQKIIILLLVGFLASCATQERREVRAQCSVESMKAYPPNIHRQMVNKTRLVSVPDGTMNCTTIGTGQFASTNCVAGTKLESVPYAAVENVDLNKSARDTVENSCVNRVCFQRYGNSQCKTQK
jgi:hypothetical protein